MSAALSPLHDRVTRVRRRLIYQLFSDVLVWSSVAALILASIWFLVGPRLIDTPSSWLRWGVAGGLILLSVVVAAVVTWWRAPSMQEAALLIDDRFNLKERVTTALGLNEREVQSLPGRALLADVENRLRPLRVGEKVPVRLSWTAGLVPLAVILLVLIVMFYNPLPNVVNADDGSKPLTDDPDMKQLVEQKKKDLKAVTGEKEADNKPKDPKLDKIKAEIDDLVNQPTETKDEAKKFVEKATEIEERIREAEKAASGKNDAVRDRFDQDERLQQQNADQAPDRLGKKKKEGKSNPAQDLNEAIKGGENQQAQDALQRLEKMLDPEQQKRLEKKIEKVKDRLKENGLTPEEIDKINKEAAKLDEDLANDEKRKDIQEALKDLEDALDRLANDKEEEKKLADKLDRQKQAAEEAKRKAEDAQKKADDARKNADDVKKNADEQKKANDAARKEIEDREKDLKAAENKADAEKRKEEIRKEAGANKDDPEAKKKAEERAKQIDDAANDATKREQEQKKAEEQKQEQDAKAKEQEQKAADQQKQAADQAKDKADEARKEANKEAKANDEVKKTSGELKDMKDNNDKIDEKRKQDFKDLSKKLGEAEKCMKEAEDAKKSGDGAKQAQKEGEAARKMQEAREQMKKMGGGEDQQALLRQLQQLQQARQAVCQAMNGNQQGNQPGNQPGNPMGTGPADGKRPLGKDGEYGVKDTFVPSEMGKGPLRVTELIKGGGEKGAGSPLQMTDELRIQAAQEGASALSRQRVERQSDTERVRGYFDNMRGTKK
jgi:hypothetical protein